ncbi:MAG: hypothetical protein GY760_05435 [Deltaproteobacteria bacterium]|nr:hypothetical protein [Deltaproteobacteria bacterium]
MLLTHIQKLRVNLQKVKIIDQKHVTKLLSVLRKSRSVESCKCVGREYLEFELINNKVVSFQIIQIPDKDEILFKDWITTFKAGKKELLKALNLGSR